MGTFKSIEDARAFFLGDRFAAVNGMCIDVLADGRSMCSMDVEENHRNAVGGIMGGVIYTLADFAFAVAANHDHNPTVALEAKINYLSAAKGNRLTATAQRVKSGRTTGVFEITVTDETGRDVALMIVTGYKL